MVHGIIIQGQKFGEPRELYKNPFFFKSKDFTCKRYWRIDSVAFKSRSKSKKFDVFDPSHPFHSPKRNQFYLSDIELTFGNTLVHFSKKSKPKKFWPKSLNLPYPRGSEIWNYLSWLVVPSKDIPFFSVENRTGSIDIGVIFESECYLFVHTSIEFRFQDTYEHTTVTIHPI